MDACINPVALHTRQQPHLGLLRTLLLSRQEELVQHVQGREGAAVYAIELSKQNIKGNSGQQERSCASAASDVAAAASREMGTAQPRVAQCHPGRALQAQRAPITPLPGTTLRFSPVCPQGYWPSAVSAAVDRPLGSHNAAARHPNQWLLLGCAWRAGVQRVPDVASRRTKSFGLVSCVSSSVQWIDGLMGV
jgi:hypothetical protein